ncbi:MAG TPA: hypothetical protein VK308_12045 [Pyrinomonadaceae bacterium]|nr:hypothetical protein [Pyrinomonadaceae bacterium]
MRVNEVGENPKYFDNLIGEQLSAVTFVMDYLQLQFNSQCLTVLNPLFVKVGGQSYTHNDTEFRNVVCERIARLVLKVTLSKQELRIDFDDSSSFAISLKEEDYSSPEAINFHFTESGKERIIVF